MKQAVEKELVFQHRFGGKGVLIGRKSWERLASIDEAIRTASTWREFQASLPEGEFESLSMWYINGGDNVYRSPGKLMFVPADVAQDFLDDQEMVIDAEDPFDPEQILGFSDGDYPPWIDATTETPLPEVLLTAFGIRADSRISGSWIEFLVEDLDGMKRVLGMAGFEVVAEVGLDGQLLSSEQDRPLSTDQ